MQKQFCKAQARVLAAGKHAHPLFPFRLRESHAVQYFFDACVNLVAICRVYHGLKLAVALCQCGGCPLRHLGLHLLQLLHGRQHRGKCVLHLLVYCALRVKRGVLLQIAHAHAAGKAKLARVRLIFAGDQF